MSTPPVSAHHGDGGTVAARAELRWGIFVIAIIALLMGMMAYTSLHWVLMPTKRIESINPSTLHISGEFVEANLGTEAMPDGTVIVRVIGQQYSFAPQCILVPDRTLVKFRGTSADAIHGFLIADTNVNVMLEPGYISTFNTQFKKPGMHVMPCHEFCGVGHAGMWARVKVIDRETFFKQAGDKRRQSCVQE